MPETEPLDDVFEGAVYSKADLAKAEAARIDAIQESKAHRLRQKLELIFESEREALIEVDPDDNAAIYAAKYTAEATSDSATDSLGKELLDQAADPSFVAAALETLSSLKEQLEKKKRRAQAMAAAAEREVKLAHKALWPVVMEYARLNDKMRSTKKGWKFSDTAATLRLVAKKDSLDIENMDEAVKHAKAVLGADTAIELGIVKITEQVSAAKLRDELCARGLPLSAIPGATFTPAHDELTLYRS